jgi:hypothetical protein
MYTKSGIVRECESLRAEAACDFIESRVVFVLSRAPESAVAHASS